MRRLGYTLVAVGRAQEGIALLEQAVRRERSSENLASLAEATAFPGPGKVGSWEARARALTLAQEAEAYYHKEVQAGYHGDDDSSYLALVGQVALSLQRYTVFRDVAGSLMRTYPHDMVTHYYAAIRAAVDEDWRGAEVEIAQAERLGLPHEAVTQFLQSGVHTRAKVWQYVHYAGYLLGAWIAGLLLLFVAGKKLSTLP